MKDEGKDLLYLTEDELMQLISDVEEHELVAAPPDFMENVLAALGEEQEEVTQTEGYLPLQENPAPMEKPPEKEMWQGKEDESEEGLVLLKECVSGLEETIAKEKPISKEKEMRTEKKPEVCVIEPKTVLCEESCAEKKIRQVTFEARRREYRGYCIRVITSVAAAVVLVLLLPEVMRSAEVSPEHKYVLAVREEVLEQGRYSTKEEAMQSRGFLSDQLSKVKIFENEWNIFERLNGGFEDETTQKE